jgi:photosystem II stability/assembly factor-like uncharacterized protein
MRNRRSWLGAGLGLGVWFGVSAAVGGWRDVLDVPASVTPLALRGLYNGLCRAGERIVAVGQRGHIMLSDDLGDSWRQAEVPVSSDLVAVHFPDPMHGWAVGHDAVVLHTKDGGQSWALQLDGRTLGRHLQGVDWAAAFGLDQEAVAKWEGEAQRFAEQGPENPFLAVWFDDPLQGYVVGAFGLALRTFDGGVTWQPCMPLLDNPKALHLYGVQRLQGALHAVGEQGLLLRENAAGRWVSVSLPYEGTLFGMSGQGNALLVHGLRGNLWRSQDGGAQWTAVPLGLAVGLPASTVHTNEWLAVVSQAGHVMLSRDQGASFQPVIKERPTPAAALVAASDTRLVVAGPRGLKVIDLR